MYSHSIAKVSLKTDFYVMLFYKLLPLTKLKIHDGYPGNYYNTKKCPSS